MLCVFYFLVRDLDLMLNWNFSVLLFGQDLLGVHSI